MVRRLLAWLVLGCSAASLSISNLPPEPKGAISDNGDLASSLSPSVDFRRDVLPILSSKCFACHGPDAAARKGGFRLDHRDAAIQPARSGEPPIIPGKASASELIRRIESPDADAVMPPPKSGKALSAAERQVLSRWIDAGAEYADHWAFVKPRRPQVPRVKRKTWPKNEIDYFLLARLEAAGLEPSPEADAVTLIRRLSFDLRGLPPSLEEVDEFVAAWNTAGAAQDRVWERWVDRMLASPHFGEKMALAWLDLARFGDTSGYHMDSTRQMWLWRDWVIDAFNRGMPFDQFTTEQMAGDLLPPPPADEEANVLRGVHSRKIASGFHRNTRFNEEGGVDPEEFVIRYNVDRTNTVGQIWLGLTLGCAECHSHKYDPISHREYYQLFAFFTGITEPMIEGHQVHGKPLEPILKVPTPEQAKQLAEHTKTLHLLEKAIATQFDRFAYADPLAGKPVPEFVPAELAARSLSAWEVRAREDEKLPADLRAILKIEPGRRSDAQKKSVREYYLRKVHADSRDLVGAFDQEQDDLAKKVRDIEEAIPHTLVTVEMAKPRPAHVLIRGDFQQRGERVEPGVPSRLGPMPKGAPPNRLGLASWLVSPDHPLTARVAVNRLWAQLFGQGIVRTLGDFGTQGDYPSHPELLDWLAIEFMHDGHTVKPAAARPWDIKRMLRTLARSAAYRQASRSRKDAAAIDPSNRLLAFMPRHRLDAEELRDSALAISGLLNPRLGGPSFMPYQPRHYYRFKNEHWPWTASAGEEQYRRGLYAFWRRTSLHPMFLAFDAPSREECVVSRARTNTPLQALVTLNDPTFVEAARVFAQNLILHGPLETDARLALAFRKATGRTPTAEERKILGHRFDQQRARFAADGDAASRLVNAGQFPRDARLDVRELAAWTAVCNLILNLDEVLTRE